MKDLRRQILKFLLDLLLRDLAGLQWPHQGQGQNQPQSDRLQPRHKEDSDLQENTTSHSIMNSTLSTQILQKWDTTTAKE